MPKYEVNVEATILKPKEGPGSEGTSGGRKRDIQ